MRWYLRKNNILKAGREHFIDSFLALSRAPGWGYHMLYRGDLRAESSSG